MHTRIHIKIYGKVQGVFFRAETQREARRLGVAGWVRNVRDGSVEAIVEGDPDSVSRLIEWCRKGSPFSRVDRVETVVEEYRNEFQDFLISR